MDNVVINFSSDPSGLQPGIVALQQLEDKDKQVAIQAQKTMEAYKSRDKTIVDSVNSAKKSIDSIVTSVSTLSKSLVGGAYTKVFSDIQKQVKLTDDQLKIFYQNIIKNAKLQLVDNSNKQDIQQLNILITQAQTALEGMAESEDKVEQKTISFKAQLRALKQEMSVLEEAGQENSAQFEQMAIKAGRLEEQIARTDARVRAMGSSTFVFDAMISGVTGLAGSFAVVQGVIGLTSDKSEDLQRALLKVNAVMSILQGLQAVQNVLQKQSAASIGIDLLLRRNQAAATTAQTLAIEGQTVATVEATTAQTGLNLAFFASPAGLILTGIAAITAAMLVFGGSTKKTTDDLALFNQQLERLGTLSDENVTKLENNTKTAIETAKSRGALESDQTRLTISGYKQEADEYQKSIDRKILSTRKFFGGDAFNVDTKELAQSNLADVQTALLNTKIDKQEKKLKESEEKFLQSIITDFSNLEKIQTDAAIAQIQLADQLTKEGLKSARAFAEAKVIIAREGSKQELQAQIVAIRAREAEELKGNLTSGERFKLQAEAEKEIVDLKNKFEIQAVKNTQTAVDARVLLAKKGSKDELDFKLQSLELGYLADITDKKKNVQQLELIDAQYLTNRKNLLKEFNQKVAEDAINSRIAELNSTLSVLSLNTVDQTNSDILAAKKQLVDEQAALEVVSIQNSENNEELRRQRIKAVYDKALADKKELERQKNAAEIDNGLSFASAVLKFEQDKAKRILDNDKSTNKQRQQAEFDLHKYTQGLLDSEELANQQRYDAGLISFDTYWAAKLAIESKSQDESVRIALAAEAKKTQVRDLAIQSAISLTTVFFNLSKAGYAAEEQQIKDLFDQKRISQEEYNNRLRILRKKQAQDDKAQALFTTLLQQGPTILAGFQKGGFAGVAAAFALFFTMLNAVTQTQIPQFRHGEVDIQGPGTTTSDSIFARISKGETVTDAEQTKKHKAALQAIHEDRYQQYLINQELPKLYQNLSLPSVPEFAQSASSNTGIDYDKMARHIAEEIANNPSTHLSFDEAGFNLSIRKNNQITEYKNKKLNT